MITEITEITETVFVHYGSNEYNPDLFQPIRNLYNKPYGGLWLSPVNSKYSWANWCSAEGFEKTDFTKQFHVRIKKGFEIFIIDRASDLNRLPTVGEGFRCKIDFERMASEGVAGIFLTMRGEHETRFALIDKLPIGLYGWDCECLLILNPDSIEPVPWGFFHRP